MLPVNIVLYALAPEFIPVGGSGNLKFVSKSLNQRTYMLSLVIINQLFINHLLI